MNPRPTAAATRSNDTFPALRPLPLLAPATLVDHGSSWVIVGRNLGSSDVALLAGWRSFQCDPGSKLFAEAQSALRGRGLAAALLLPRRPSDRCAPSLGPSSTPQYLGCADFHIKGRGALHLDANGSHVVMCSSPTSPDIPRWRRVEPADDAGCSHAGSIKINNKSESPET